MSQDQIFAMFVAFISLFILLFGYLLVWLRRRTSKKMGEIGKSKIEDDAYNQMQMVRAMSKVMDSRGYNVSFVSAMLVKAERAYDEGRYAECLEIANNAKRMLMRIKNEEKMEDKVSPHIEKELEIIKRIGEKKNKEEMPPQVKDFVKKLPPNYLQSKFEIEVVEEKIEKYAEGQIKEAAKLYLMKAKDAFRAKNYTDALKFAIRSSRILDGGEVTVEREEEKKVPEVPRISPLIEEEEEEKEEELRCPRCGAIVRPEDKYCWNCGAKLIFIYTCPNCGAEVSSEDKYCRHCGYKLR